MEGTGEGGRRDCRGKEGKETGRGESGGKRNAVEEEAVFIVNKHTTSYLSYGYKEHNVSII